MTAELEDALASWESGELSRDELARRFPEEDIAGLLDAFDRMSTAAVAPAPDARAAWEVVRVKLPARLAERRRGRGRAIRLLAAAMIAVLVLGASAYAVVPSVRKALDDAAGVITGPDHAPRPTRPADGTGSGADQPSPDISGGDASAAGSDDGAAAENDGQADANEHDADDGSNAGTKSGSNDAEGEVDSGTDDGSASDDVSVDDSSGEEAAGDAVDGDSSGSASEGPES
jgi:hypothetical protein